MQAEVTTVGTTIREVLYLSRKPFWVLDTVQNTSQEPL